MLYQRVNKEKFPLYGYICSSVAILFFLPHILYLIDRCPFGISTVLRLSMIQVILAILAMYFGCCSETKKSKISVISGVTVLLLVVTYYILVIQPCMS